MKQDNKCFLIGLLLITLFYLILATFAQQSRINHIDKELEDLRIRVIYGIDHESR